MLAMVGAYLVFEFPTIDLPPSFGVWLAIVAWFFFVGAAIGSFLNVVIYRLPRGQSVVHPGSRCPACGHAIRGYDNIPIASWLILRGRCRDCGAAFSSRYMWIELFTALGLAYLLAIEPLRGMASPWQHGFDTPHFARFAGLGLLFCTLVSAAFIQFDGQPIPRRLFLFGALVGLALTVAFPSWHVLAWNATTTEAPLAASRLEAIVTAFVGAAASTILAALVWPIACRGVAARVSLEAILGSAVVGLYFGWQVAITPVLLAAILGWLAAKITGRQVPLMALLVAMLIQVPALPLTLRLLGGASN